MPSGILFLFLYPEYLLQSTFFRIFENHKNQYILFNVLIYCFLGLISYVIILFLYEKTLYFFRSYH